VTLCDAFSNCDKQIIGGIIPIRQSFPGPMCGTANPSTIALADALESGVETRVSKKLFLYSYYTQLYKTRYSRMKEMIISQSERVDDVESWILEQIVHVEEMRFLNSVTTDYDSSSSSAP